MLVSGRVVYIIILLVVMLTILVSNVNRLIVGSMGAPNLTTFNNNKKTMMMIVAKNVINKNLAMIIIQITITIWPFLVDSNQV